MSTSAETKADIALMDITVDMAADWLSQNNQNRTISKALVRTYARAISEDRWKVNGETIKISPEGALIDGQHRLLACQQAKKIFPSYVAFNVDQESFDTIDTGRKRQAGDILTIEGVRNARAMAAAIRWLIVYEGRATSDRVIFPTADEILAKYKDVPDISESFLHANKTRDIVRIGVGIFCHYIFSNIDIDQADIFFADLSSGANLAEDDPVLKLREALLRDRASKARLPPMEIATRMIRAWNARRSGRGVSHVKGRVRSSKKSPKHLPEAA